MADEKFDEKELEKRDEKSNEKSDEKSDEKSWDEKWQRDPLSAVLWAAIFIWAGLVFLASNLGILDWALQGASEITGLGMFNNVVRAWPLVLVGVGVIILIVVVIRLLVPAYRKPVTGSVILAVILIGIGLGDLINWGIIWGVILIVLGIWILTRGSRRSRE
jgi:hypothetical protein